MNAFKNINLISLIIISLYNPFKLFGQYDPKYVEISSDIFNNISYDYVGMTRTGNHVSVKYFGAKENGSTVAERYNLWKNGRKIICVTNATFTDNTGTPIGLSIENGKLVNGTLESFDGLVIVYATGGVVATNLKNVDLTVQGENIPSGLKLDLRNNPMHLQMFIEWAASQKANVFQTFLLVYKNQLDSTINNDPTKKRDRRFLSVGKDSSGKIIYSIINSSEPETFFEGTKKTLDFLNERKKINVIFMISLDAGAQDIFFLNDENGNVLDLIKGSVSLENAANLLVYYYEE